MQLISHKFVFLMMLLDTLFVYFVSGLILIVSEHVGSNWHMLIPVVTATIFMIGGVYKPVVAISNEIKHASTLFFSVLVASIFVYVLLKGTDASRLQFLALWAPCIFLSTYCLRLFCSSRNGVVPEQSILLLGVPENLKQELQILLPSRLPSIRLLVDDFNDHHPDHEKYLSKLYETSPNTILVYGDELLNQKIVASSLLSYKLKGFDVYNVRSFYSDILGRIRVDNAADITYTSSILDQGSIGFTTRLLDGIRNSSSVIVGWLLVVPAAIPMLIVALLVKFSSPGPVLFKQERLGLNKRKFYIYKFRTMGPDAENNGPRWASANDQRVTPMGKLLRELHLDELPQLINICRGEINFVGPRPIREHFANILANEISNYDLRFLVRPGLTGWAQALGPYGENMAEQKEKFEYDLYYIANRLRLSDVMILGMTLGKILSSTYAVFSRSLDRAAKQDSTRK